MPLVSHMINNVYLPGALTFYPDGLVNDYVKVKPASPEVASADAYQTAQQRKSLCRHLLAFLLRFAAIHMSHLFPPNYDD